MIINLAISTLSNHALFLIKFIYFLLFLKKMGSQIKRKYVTLEEASSHLPKVSALLCELQVLQEALALFDAVELEVDEGNLEQLRSVTKFNKEYHRLSYLFYTKIEKLEKYGCYLKDLDEGLVDFLYSFEGRDVFLCWKDGEKDILHWHEIDAGFEGRKKIVDLTNLQHH